MLLSGVHSGIIRIMQSVIDVSLLPTILYFEVSLDGTWFETTEGKITYKNAFQ